MSDKPDMISRAETDRLIAEAVAAVWDAAMIIVAEYPARREKSGFDWRAEVQSALNRAKLKGGAA